MIASFSVPEGEPFGFKVDPLDFDDLTQRLGIAPAHYLARHTGLVLRTGISCRQKRPRVF